MAHPGSEFETEIKLPAGDPQTALHKLESAGLQVSKPRVFEANTIYDTPDGSLRGRGCVLRVRNAGETTTVTFKGPAVPGAYKTRPETEFTASDASAAASLFRSLGFVALFRYEKFRTEFQDSGRKGTATLDETPIGCYIELEGEPEWIDAVAAALGFHRSDYLTSSYGSLYLEHCRLKGLTPGHMVFGSSKVESSTDEK